MYCNTCCKSTSNENKDTLAKTLSINENSEGLSLKKWVVLFTILQDGYGPVGCGMFI